MSTADREDKEDGMSYIIRVSPDILRQKTEAINEIAAQNEDIKNRIRTLAEKLDAAWDGPASREMVTKLEELQNYTAQVEEGLQESSNLILQVANAFAQIDGGESISIAIRMDLISKLKNLVAPSFTAQLGLYFEAIRVSPEELRAVAAECNVLNEDVMDTANRVSGIADDLQASWEGRAYDRFEENFLEIRRAYRSLADSLEEFSTKIRNVADRYEEIDNMFN